MLLIAPQPFYSARGTPMNVRQMCRVLGEAGWQVDLATYPLGEDLALPGLRIWRTPRVPGIDSVPIGFSLRKLVLDALLALLVARLVLLRRYDLVHAVEEGVFMALPFTWLGTRLVWDLDSRISDQLRYGGVLRSRFLLGLVERLERLALRRSRGAITVCQALTDAAHALVPAARVFQVEDAPLEESLREPDAQRVEALRSELKLEQRPVVVYTGNLEGYQGIDLLLSAWEQLRLRVSGCTLILVGGTPGDVARRREELARRGLAECVLLVGQRPTDEMPEWMALGQALVSPRCDGENTPLKIYTYMRSGRPVVATDLPTHTQVLDSSLAVLCEPTPEGLADGLACALGDPELAARLGRRAREVAIRDYGYDSFRRKLLGAYAELSSTTD